MRMNNRLISMLYNLNNTLCLWIISLMLVLPWPDRRLSPNARVHWATRAKASKQAKQLGFLAAQRAGWYLPDLDEEASLIQHYSRHIQRFRFYRLLLNFYPPDRRKRDDDNLVAAFKPYRDGIAQALGMDDHRFSCMPTVHHEVIFPKGKVEVKISLSFE